MPQHPFTGNIEDSVVMKSARIQSTHPTETGDRLRYVVYSCLYTSQEEDDENIHPPEGTRGSVVWDDDGVVLGFYREVVEADYDLAKE
ncbi:hypothetical protein F4779DRAFT_637594 [Xylariaceae sp. FL0662B]|nr:hypothetical protein F4779DRAFT_637594 [Xylariaceae sp. FL0662B]